MEFKFIRWPIRKLIDVIDNGKIDLKPSFQRNFIWSPTEQKQLIDSIVNSYYPLPTFFIFQSDYDYYIMVDGQQRSRSIYLFHKGDLTDSYKNKIRDVNKDDFYGYPLNISLITGLDKNDSLEAFYSLVNKTGKRLNIPELYKAQYHGKKFYSL